MKIIACILSFIMGFCIAYMWLIPYDNTTAEEVQIQETKSKTLNIDTMSEDDLQTATEYASNRYARVGYSYQGTSEGCNNRMMMYDSGEMVYRSYYVSVTSGTYNGDEDLVYLYYTYRYIGVRICDSYYGKYLQIATRQWTRPDGINQYIEITNKVEKLEVIAVISSAESLTESGDSEEALVAFVTSDYDMEMTSSTGTDYAAIYEDERVENNLIETVEAILDNGYCGFQVTIANVEETPDYETLTVYDNNGASTTIITEYKTRVQEEDFIITDENLIAGPYFTELWATNTSDEVYNNFTYAVFTKEQGNYTTYTIGEYIGYSPATYLASNNIMITNNGPIAVDSYGDTVIQINDDIIILDEDEEIGQYKIITNNFDIEQILLVYMGTTTQLDVGEYLTSALNVIAQLDINDLTLTIAIEAIVSLLLVWTLIKMFAHK